MSARSLVPVLTAMLGVAAAWPVAARDAGASCGAIVLSGAAGATIFVDGFESADATAWERPYPASYSIAANVDLGVVVPVVGAGAEGVLELKWRLPGGPLYQSVALPFAVDPAPRAQRRLDGYPFAVPVRRLRSDTHAGRSGPDGPVAPELETSFALAGTSIVESALWGEWTLEAFLDGSDEACTSPLRFRLEP